MAREEEEYVDDDENEDSDFAADGDDDEVDEEDAEEEEAPSKKGSSSAGKKRGRKAADDKAKKKKKKGSHFFDEEADEDEDDEEEDGGGRRKKSRAAQFFDDIAAVDDDEEEDEADEDADDILADNAEDLGGEDLGGAAHYRELDRQRQNHRMGGGGTEEEMLQYLRDKYTGADDGEMDEYDDYEAYGEEEDVGQQGLQPSKEDPGLFILQCKIGCEREACMQLLQKVYNFHEQGKMLEIKSAVTLDHLKGFIYVEAFKDSHVLEAIRGLRTIYSGKGAKLVPLKERPAAVSVNRQAKAAIERDSWVRVRGGLYKDDLAKVLDVDFAAGRATIKLVPRLDLAAMAKDHRSGTSRRMPFGRQTVRPPPRPFKAKEAGELGLPVGRDKQDTSVVVLNTHRFVEGYTIRGITLKGLILQESAPPLDEISRFNAAGQTEAEDMNDPTASLETLLKALPDKAAPRGVFVKGDRVVVIAGDLNTLEGVVEDTRPDEGKLLVRPDMMRDQVVELELAEVQKLFKPGDHVRVLNGPHAGERGMVVSVDGTQCVLLPDTRQAELKVFVRDLTEAKESGTGVETLGGKYELHDLVQLDAHTAGIIVGINKDTARVLTNQSTLQKNDIRLCREADILRKLQANRASTQDMSGNTINVGDYVTLVDTAGAAGPPGVRKERGGTVHAISRGVLFIKCQEVMEKGGFLVVRNRQIRVRGGKAPAAAAAAAATAEGPGGPVPASYLASPQHALDAGAQNPFGGRGGGRDGGRGGGRHGGSALMGQELMVRSGPYARYKGRVKQETATHLQLELDAINRIVTVKKEDVLGKQGQGMQPARGGYGYNPNVRPAAGYGYNPGAAGQPRTPAHVMATPMHPSQGGSTPLHPSQRTPLHPSATPMHPSMTPMHPGMTPMHPSNTPAHPSQDPEPDYYNMREGSSSRDRQQQQHHQPPPPAAATPGGGGYNAPTPGIGSYTAAATPGMAETPGGAFAEQGNARTPGAAAATPGGPDSYAYTPAGQTPAEYAPAPTPGAQDLAAPVAPHHPGGYYQNPTPGMGLTPSLTPGFTPGLGGYTPAFTPGLEGATPGGIPGTPGFPGALDPGSLGHGGQQGLGLPTGPRRPDYAGILVRLPDGQAAVAGATDAAGNTEAVAVGGGAGVLLDVVELVEAERKDWVKVVSGDFQGKVGQVIAFDGSDLVLGDGEIVESGMVGKLAVPPDGHQHGDGEGR